MNCKSLVLFTGALLLVIGGAAGPVTADHFIKQVTNTDAFEMMGKSQPATSDTAIMWISDGKSAMIGSDGNVYIFQADKNLLYAVNHEKQTFAEMTMDIADYTEGMDEEEAEAMKAMTQQMIGSMKVTVTPTDETRKIGDWNTTKHIVDMTAPMGNTTTELWATEDIEVDYDAFKSVANAAMAMMPGYDQMLAEMRKIEGIPVQSVTEMKIMGATMRSSMELIEFAEKDAPAGTFEVPEGYRKVEMVELAPGH